MNVPSMLLRVRTDLEKPTRSRDWQIMGTASTFLMTLVAILNEYRGCGCILTGYDDAYITYRYAQNLATGKGLIFNVGDSTDSASSFLYTLVLAFAHRIGMHDLPFVATTIGVACAAGVAASVFLICLEYTARPLLALLLGLAVGTHGMVSGWAVSGMETLFFMLLVTVSAWRLFVRNALGWFEAALVTATLLTRYEGVLLAAAWLVLVVARFPKASLPEQRSLIRQAAAISASFGLFLAFKYWMYGTVLPHAFALKTIAQLYAPRPYAIWEVWSSMAPALLLFAVAGLLLLPRRVESAAFVAYCAASTLAVVIGPSSDFARYSVHLLPLAGVVASLSLGKLIRGQLLLGLAACWLIASQSYTTLRDMNSTVQSMSKHAICRRQIGAFMERTLKPGTTVLSSDIGVIAYAAPSIAFVDAVGLTSKDVLEAHERGQSVDPFLLARKPLVIADTCRGACMTPPDFSTYEWLSNQRYWRTKLASHEYSSQLHSGRVLDRCTTPDGLSFAATRFELSNLGAHTP